MTTDDGGGLTDGELDAMQARVEAASPGPWTSYVEGRDHHAGDSVIRVSESDDEDDLYVLRADENGLRPASAAHQDFIAHARQDVPRLISEVRRLRGTT